MKNQNSLFKYVKKVCFARFDDESKPFYMRKLIGENGEVFSIRTSQDQPMRVGSETFIAKPLQTLKHSQKIFTIHKVILPPNELYLRMAEKCNNPKDKRISTAKAYADRSYHSFHSSGLKSFLVINNGS